MDVIQKNWQELIKPNKLNIEPGVDPKRKAVIVADALLTAVMVSYVY